MHASALSESFPAKWANDENIFISFDSREQTKFRADETKKRKEKKLLNHPIQRASLRGTNQTWCVLFDLKLKRK